MHVAALQSWSIWHSPSSALLLRITLVSAAGRRGWRGASGCGWGQGNLCTSSSV
jgi:hypothetical protein